MTMEKFNKPKVNDTQRLFQTYSSEKPWVEKYRPKTLDDIIGNEKEIINLKNMVEQGSIPNLILAGNQGSGKTSSILCLCRQLLGSNIKETVLELNASDDRGISVVREKIKMFAQKKVTLKPGSHKIIILDEADSMTNTAQQSLRRIMEEHSNTTRFAMSCNISSKIIEPIQSRCVILRFNRLSDNEMMKKLLEVSKEENVKIEPGGLDAILFTAEGDMRNALNNLQATHNGFGTINSENVYKVCDKPHPEIVKKIIKKCIINSTNDACLIMTDLYNQGYSAIDIIGTVFKIVRDSDDAKLDENNLRLNYIKEVGITHMRILDGLDSIIQLNGLVSRLSTIKN
jgi:replication factor C subunit 2/4